MQNFLIIGGDLRQSFLAELLKKQGNTAAVYPAEETSCITFEEAVNQADVLLCPVPFTKNQKTIFSLSGREDLTIERLIGSLKKGCILFGGPLPPEVKAACRAREALCYDYMEMEEITIKNAVATAEGAIAEAIRLSPLNLHKSPCLVLGYGRCGKILAQKLKGMDADVTIMARRQDQRALGEACGFRSLAPDELAGVISRFLFVFNTVPCKLLDQAAVSRMNSEVSIIDIASAPGGTDFKACSQAKLRAVLCPGLPGNYSPESSAEILYEAVRSRLQIN